MGCAPSQTGIIQHIARTTLKPLKQTRTLMPSQKIPTENFTHSLQENSSNCTSDSESNLGEEENCYKVGPRRKREGCSKSLSSSDLSPRQRSARLPEFNNQGKKAEKLAAETEVAKSEQIILEKCVTQERGVVEGHSSGLAEVLQQNSEANPVPQQPKKTKKPKGRQLVKHNKDIKTRTKSEDKVEFPDLLVQSHQAAYAFLNPSLSKYEAIMTLTEQATQTQLILQQMVSFLAFRFEEVNQALEEIVIGGEKLVKRVGDNLTWPTENGILKDQPDLLQQLLQYTVNKMQAVNGRVAQVTNGALQETCCYLQSATDIFQEKLMAKQQMDERLQRLIAHLEARATQRSHSAPDMTLYSEDSGIGADNDSLKEYCMLDKYRRRVSCDVNTYPLCTNSHRRGCPTQACVSNAPICSSKSHDCAVEQRFKDILYSSNAPCSSLMKMGTSANSFDSNSTIDAESLKCTESMDLGSLDEEDTNESDTETITDGMVPQRPSSTPIDIGSLRSGPKRIDNPENEEMTIKLKDAISGRIQFVPITPATNTWSDEDSKPYHVRPSTANVCKTTITKQKRSRSAESLRSKAEDPTLLQLQRTQKDLSKRLDKMFQAKEINKEKQKTTQPRIAANAQSTDQATLNSKLKASLNKNFSILPSPDRVMLKKNDQGNSRQQEDRKSRRSPVKTVPAKHNSANAKESQTPKSCGAKSAKQPQHKSVKKLIDTFSQGNDNEKSENPKVSVKMKRAKQLGVRILPHVAVGSRDLAAQRHVFPAIEDLSDQQEPVLSSETLLPPAPTDQCQEGFPQGEEEMESFPPPPSNTLLENLLVAPTGSGITSATPTNPLETTDKRAAKVNFILPKTLAAQKLRASLNSVDVLPSRNRRVGAFRLQKRPEQVVSLSHSTSESSQQEPLETQHRLCRRTSHYPQSYKIINLKNTAASSSTEDLSSEPIQFPDSRASQVQNKKECVRDCGGEILLKETNWFLPPTECQLQNSCDSVANGSTASNAQRVSTTRCTALSPPIEKQIQLSSISDITGDDSPTTTVRRTTVTTSIRPSLPLERKLPSPQLQPRNLFQATRCTPPSPPSERKPQSPPTQPRRFFQVPTGIPSSPPPENRLTSPPVQPKYLFRAISKMQASPPTLHREMSPPDSARMPSPPIQRKQASPPTQRKLPSPPSQRKQTNLPSNSKFPSPPTGRKEVGSGLYPTTSSPPISPRMLQRAFRHNLQVGEETQASMKIASNASSIFCPSSDSMFEAKPPSPPTCFDPVNSAGHSQVCILGDGSPMTSRSAWRNSFMFKQYGDQQRRSTLSGVYPQPFVKRNFASDCRTGFPLQPPVSISTSAGSEPTLHRSGYDENSSNEGDVWKSQYASDLRGSNRSASHPELCVVGQGLQRD